MSLFGLRLHIRRAVLFTTTPTLTWVSGSSVNPPILNAAVPPGYMISGDSWEIQFDEDTTFASPTQLSGTVSAADAIDADISASSGVYLSDGISFARFRVLRGGNPITNWSNIASQLINAPPIMTSTNEFHITEGAITVGTLTATQSATFSVGGTDASFFQLSGSTLQFVTAPDFDAPADANADNRYAISITPTALHDSEVGSPQSIIVQVEPIADYPETTAFLNRAVTSGGTVGSRLNTLHLNAVKAFINGLLFDNIWNNFDAIYLIATQSIGSDGMDIARMNLRQNAFNCTGVGMTWVEDRGFTPGGGSAFFNSQFNPATVVGSKYSLNDAHLSVWGNTNGTRSDMGYGSGGMFTSIGINSTGASLAINQAGGGGSIATPAAFTGFYYGQRTASNAMAAYMAAPNAGTISTVGTATTVSSVLTNGQLAIGAVSGQNYSNRQMAAASIGKSMPVTDIEKFYDRLQAYMTAIGNS